jgi:hypothetical protein
MIDSRNRTPPPSPSTLLHGSFIGSQVNIAEQYRTHAGCDMHGLELELAKLLCQSAVMSGNNACKLIFSP